MKLRAIRRRYYRHAVAAARPMMPAGWMVLHSDLVVDCIGGWVSADELAKSVDPRDMMIGGTLRRGEVCAIDDAITLTLSQKLTAAGFTRRPTWRSLPKDFTDDECE